MPRQGISITIKRRLSGSRAVPVRWMVIGGAIRVMSGFIANLVLVRFISPEEFGRFALVLASIGIVFAFHPFRIYHQVLRIKNSELYEDTQQLYFSALIQQSFAFGLIALGVVYLTGLGSVWSLLLVGSIVLNHFTQNVKSFFERKMPYKRLAVIETTALVGGHLLAVIIAVSGAGAAALKEKIVYLYEDRDRCREMGASALERVRSGFSWQDYGDRMVAEYESILSSPVVREQR